MGASTSIYQSSYQESVNTVTQTAQANCINSCVSANSGIGIVVKNTEIIGDINITSVCFINGASCVLKSSLDSEILNSLKNLQEGSIKQEFDPFSAIAYIGSDSSITQTNYQRVVNSVTQGISATCFNPAEARNEDVYLNFEGSKVTGNINISAESSVSNTACAITNIAKSFLKNDLSNDQSAKIEQLGCLAGIGGIIVGAIIIFAMFSAMKHKNHQDKAKEAKDKGKDEKVKEEGEELLKQVLKPDKKNPQIN